MRADLHLYTMYKFGPIGIELCRHDRVTFTEGFPALGGGRRGVRTRDRMQSDVSLRWNTHSALDHDWSNPFDEGQFRGTFGVRTSARIPTASATTDCDRTSGTPRRGSRARADEQHLTKPHMITIIIARRVRVVRERIARGWRPARRATTSEDARVRRTRAM